MRWIQMVVAGAALLFLSGCGGGGNGGGSIIDRGPEIPDGEIYSLPSVDVTHDLLFLLGSPSVPTSSGTQYTIEPFVASCQQGSQCWATTNADSIEGVTDRGGVLVLRLRGVGIYTGTEYDTYGGWMDSTVFSVVRSCASADGCAHGSFDIVSVGVAGAPTGYVPTSRGSASWAGSVVGADTTTSNVILGDARIIIDNLANPNVDVSLTGMREVVSGAGRADIHWEKIPMLSNGVFVRGYSPYTPGFTDAVGEYIIGQLHGATGQEVGGYFESAQHTMRGAFGGKLQ